MVKKNCKFTVEKRLFKTQPCNIVLFNESLYIYLVQQNVSEYYIPKLLLLLWKAKSNVLSEGPSSERNAA